MPSNTSLKGKPSHYVGVRMLQRDFGLMQKVCQARGEDVSDFVRRAVKIELAKLSYLSETEKRALGGGNNEFQRR